jgi:hypothetical protein
MDKRGLPVPTVQLTSEQVSFQKKFSQLQKVRGLLEQKGLQIKQDMGTLTKLYGTLNQEYQKLQIPTESIRDLSGMNFSDNVEQSQDTGTATQDPRTFSDKVQIKY